MDVVVKIVVKQAHSYNMYKKLETHLYCVDWNGPILCPY